MRKRLILISRASLQALILITGMLTKVEDEDDILPPPFSMLQTLFGEIDPEDPVSYVD